jgi:flagellar hook-length control protein FliK
MSSMPLEIPIVATPVESSVPRPSSGPVGSDANSFGDHLQRAKAPATEVQQEKDVRAQDNPESTKQLSQTAEATKTNSESREQTPPVSGKEIAGRDDEAADATDKESGEDLDETTLTVADHVVATNAVLQLAPGVTAADEQIVSHEVTEQDTEKEQALLIPDKTAKPKSSLDGKKLVTTNQVASQASSRKETASDAAVSTDKSEAKQTATSEPSVLAKGTSQDTVTQAVAETSNEPVPVVSESDAQPKKPPKSKAADSRKVDQPDATPSTELSLSNVDSPSPEATDSPEGDTEKPERGERRSSTRSAPSDPTAASRARANSLVEPPSDARATISAPSQAQLAVTPGAEGHTEAAGKQRENTKTRRTQAISADASTPPASPEVPQRNSNANPTTQTSSAIGTRTTASLSDLPAASGLGSKTTAPNTNLNEVDRVRFVQRVTRAVMSAAERGGDIRLRLSPPELGSIKLEVIVREGVMNARLETQTEAAKSILLDNLPGLRERLAQQDIQIDQFDVDVQSGFSGSLPDRTPEQQQATSRHSTLTKSPNSGLVSEGHDATATQGVAYRISRDGRLNVIV